MSLVDPAAFVCVYRSTPSRPQMTNRIGCIPEYQCVVKCCSQDCVDNACQSEFLAVSYACKYRCGGSGHFNVVSKRCSGR